MTYCGHCPAADTARFQDCMPTVRTRVSHIDSAVKQHCSYCHKLHIAVLTIRRHKQISKTHTTPRLTASVLSHYLAHTCYLLTYELRVFRSHLTANTRPVC